MNMKYLLFTLALFCANADAEPRGFSNEYQSCLSRVESIDMKSDCTTQEIARQKRRLNSAYRKVSSVLSAEDKKVLDKVQRDWLTWRDGNYNFLAEHVAGEYATTRTTSLNFLLNSVCDRANELETVLTESGH